MGQWNSDGGTGNSNCGTVGWKTGTVMVEQSGWNSGTVMVGQWNSTVVQCAGTVEQSSWNSVLEQ